MENIKKYIESIRRYPLLVKDREKKIARIIFFSRNKDNVEKAKQEMIRSNLRLVISRASSFNRRYQHRNFNIMDLIAEGNMGLIKAVDHYRVMHPAHASFATFAIYYIDRYIQNFLHADQIIHIPSYLYSLKMKLNGLEANLLTDEEIMEELGISKEVLFALKNNMSRAALLEDMFGSDNEGEKVNWQEKIKDENAEDPYVENCNNSLGEHLKKHMAMLNDRERMAITVKHLSGQDSDFQELGKILKISRERARQIYYVAMKKLKNRLIKEWNEKHEDKVESKDKKSIWRKCFYSNWYNDYGSDYIKMGVEKEHQEHMEKCKKIFKELTVGEHGG